MRDRQWGALLLAGCLLSGSVLSGCGEGADSPPDSETVRRLLAEDAAARTAQAEAAGAGHATGTPIAVTLGDCRREGPAWLCAVTVEEEVPFVGRRTRERPVRVERAEGRWVLAPGG